MRQRMHILLAASWLAGAGTARAAASELWGTDGASWTPASRLPDFSFAGYAAGEEPIPDVPVRVDVRDFGAAGDGERDDSEAFLRAIAAAQDGAVLVPAGRYKIAGRLSIRKSGVVLRGQGDGKTTLYFPEPLERVVGPGKGKSPGGSWSWSGGFLSFEGRDRGKALARVVAPAARGETRLSVDSAGSLSPGRWVRLVMTDTDGTLARELYAGQKDGPPQYRGQVLVDFAAPIRSVEDGAVVLGRPLRTDVRPEWKPVLAAMEPTVRKVGVEDMTLEFPDKQYSGHLAEPGFNAVSFEGVVDGWVRRVGIVNADSGVFFRDRTRFCTAESLRFSAAPGRLREGRGRDREEPQGGGVGGHHGILMLGLAQDNLASDFRMEFRFVHDLSVSAWSAGNVFAKGSAPDMDFDHHRRAPYENLFTSLEAGEGSRLWSSGGDPGDGPPAGARETFWGVRARRPQKPPDWVQANFVGVTSASPAELSKAGVWWEPIPPADLAPSDLYSAQRARRAKRRAGRR